MWVLGGRDGEGRKQGDYRAADIYGSVTFTFRKSRGLPRPPAARGPARPPARVLRAPTRGTDHQPPRPATRERRARECARESDLWCLLNTRMKIANHDDLLVCFGESGLLENEPTAPAEHVFWQRLVFLDET